MKPLPHLPLPLANTAAFTAGRAYGPPRADEWQLALQRALGTPPAAAAATAYPAAHPAAREDAASARTPEWRLSADAIAHPLAGAGAAAIRIEPSGAAHATATVGAMPTRAPLITGGHSSPPVSPAFDLVPAGNVPVDDEPASQRPAAGARQRPPTECPAPRVHLEHNASGLSVWLGLDGDAAAVRMQAAAVLVELQRAVSATGPRLVRVVCNGAPIYTAPHLEKETS